MSYADKIFKNMCKDILNNGIDTKGELVRPIWPDTGEKAYTIKKFGIINKYDLRKEFPAITLRPVPIKTAVDEILWIWQKKSNKVKDLGSHIWDEWQDKEGTIGKAYGYQIGQKYNHHIITEYNVKNEYDEDLYFKFYKDIDNYMNKIDKSIYPSAESNIDIKSDPYKKEFNIRSYLKLDQIDSVIWDLKHNPYSRRIMTNIYNFNDLYEMGLYPCAYSMTFNVTKDKDSDKLILNAILNQRSQDVLAANAFNVCQYAVLIHMIAQCCNMIAGEFIHVISDCHIYDRHISIIEELISREEYPTPEFWINPDIHNFYNFTNDDVKLINYEHGPQIKNIPVAV